MLKCFNCGIQTQQGSWPICDDPRCNELFMADMPKPCGWIYGDDERECDCGEDICVCTDH